MSRSAYAQKNLERRRRLCDASMSTLRAEGVIDAAILGGIGAVLTGRRLFLFSVSAFFSGHQR